MDVPDYISIIDNRRNQIGMTIRALARKVNMSDDLLSRTLKGKRKMTASEFIMLSYVLGLSLEDYPIEAERAV
jgi:DNA-binding helix-turn-helix protein|nr:MAG TPA: Helix-turn-helix XRE-family like protein [Caudoviricetes sp.]